METVIYIYLVDCIEAGTLIKHEYEWKIKLFDKMGGTIKMKFNLN